MRFLKWRLRLTTWWLAHQPEWYRRRRIETLGWQRGQIVSERLRNTINQWPLRMTDSDEGVRTITISRDRFYALEEFMSNYPQPGAKDRESRYVHLLFVRDDVEREHLMFKGVIIQPEV